MTRLRIVIAGAAGRMGQALASAAASAEDLQIVAGTERPGIDAPAAFPVLCDPANAARDADAFLDFTTPTASLAALEALAATPVKAVVIGATGFTPDEQAQISRAAKRFAIVQSGNFSLGVALLAALARRAAEALGPEWDIEIVEAHHRHKLDAPSGTALLLGEAVAEGRGSALKALRLPPRDGRTGPRPQGGIGFSVVRGGGLVGAHAAHFLAEREMITLAHEAFDRSVFADGALAAARWARDKPPGLYSVADVLGL